MTEMQQTLSYLFLVPVIVLLLVGGTIGIVELFAWRRKAAARDGLCPTCRCSHPNVSCETFWGIYQ